MTRNDRIDFLFRLLTDDELWFYWQLWNAPLEWELFGDQAEEGPAEESVH